MFYIGSPKSDGEIYKSDGEIYIDCYDADCNHIDLAIDGFEYSGQILEKDESIEKMMEIASILSRGIPQVRVDFYKANGNVYFGELTFFHASGIFDIEPEKWDRIMGDWIKLPKNEIEK